MTIRWTVKSRGAGLALMMLGVCAAGAQPTVPIDVDRNAAEQHYAIRHAPSLHSQETLPDGARGFLRPVPQAYENPNVRVPPPFQSKDQWYAHLAYCNADVIVVGELVDSTPVLMSSKAAIYTVSRFTVVQVIKGSMLPGQIITTYRLGGEVTDEGERLRVEMPDTPAYKLDTEYLLPLTQDRVAGRIQYVAPDYGTILVKGGRVSSNLGKWAGFLPGTTYAEVASTFAHVASEAGCTNHL
jgi:hypothetical protein